MNQRSRLGGVTRSAALAATLIVAAACNSSAGGSATPTPGASAPAVVPTASATTATASATGAPVGTPLEVLDFTLSPLTVVVAGPDVALAVSNAGPTVHNVTIRDAAGVSLGATRDLREGEVDTLEAAALPAGTYILFCSLPGHESLGIKGTLEVSAP